jgi:cation diffusion facilitator CzcD-associated flavoprotein CzcO
LDIRFHQEVVSAGYKNDKWEVQTQDNLYRSANLVIAAGNTHEPVIPTWPGQDLFKGRILHSSPYKKNGEPFKGQQVLVVGFGNSANYRMARSPRFDAMDKFR